jgi:hypothetical protein
LAGAVFAFEALGFTVAASTAGAASTTAAAAVLTTAFALAATASTFSTTFATGFAAVSLAAGLMVALAAVEGFIGVPTARRPSGLRAVARALELSRGAGAFWALAVFLLRISTVVVFLSMD